MRPPADATPAAILPPFDEVRALLKVKLAEYAWNTRDPERVVQAYTEDSQWRNRGEFLTGRDAIRAFLVRKWRRELEYRLRKELWAFTDNRISVRFEYECRTADGSWWRSHGNEHWEFDETTGLMRRRDASVNDVRISAAERRIAAN
jgi:nuclear transport factor 2 (NTF2) superfamily protein